MCVFVFRYLVPIGVVGGFTDADIVIPSPGPAYSLISTLSAVLTIFHFFHLSYCCLDRLCPFVGYQHLIFSSMARAFDACVRRLCAMVIILRHPTTIPLLMHLIHRPYRPWFLSPSAL